MIDTQEAKEMGRAAYRRGLPSAPVLDKHFVQELSPLVGKNIKNSAAWAEGWTAANLEDEHGLQAESI